ncbi:cis-prenyltransferase [Marasmius crinis-equi]|uniref:Cis-prenyltransferase n=1 Tax=Marasmius crinis-equi TaxID=585013 RepID=A0ABR3EIT5_9AGAR
MPYSSRDEITTAVESCVREVVSRSATKKVYGEPPMNITPEMISSHLMTTQRGSPPDVDILIRTSGVTRFSDYMLWQSNERTQIHFVDAYWPDFGLLDFVPIILQYQWAVWSGRVTPQRLRRLPSLKGPDPKRLASSRAEMKTK